MHCIVKLSLPFRIILIHFKKLPKDIRLKFVYKLLKPKPVTKGSVFTVPSVWAVSRSSKRQTGGQLQCSGRTRWHSWPGSAGRPLPEEIGVQNHFEKKKENVEEIMCMIITLRRSS